MVNADPEVSDYWSRRESQDMGEYSLMVRRLIIRRMASSSEGDRKGWFPMRG